MSSAAIMCASISAPTNGVIMYSTGTLMSTFFNHGTMATYMCNTGYGLVGGASRLCGGDGLTPTGSWSGQMATCERKLIDHS